MASLGSLLLDLGQRTATVDPPGECPTCSMPVPEVASDIKGRAVEGEHRAGVVELLVSTVAFTVTAQPCGHLLTEWRKDDDD